jgi:uncharacterized membrane protein
MSYDLLPIALPLIFAYFLSYVLYRGNLINKSIHVRLWNILILLSFLVAGIMGILLAGYIDFGVTDPFDLIFWHGEVGIALIVILFFHLHCNWSAFINSLSKVMK